MRREDSHWWREGFTAEWWTALNPAGRIAFLDLLDDRQLEEFHYDWRIWGRDKQLAPEGNWSEWLLLCGRGFGKALDLSTPIPTPSGWVTMGTIKTGDIVFDENGKPCRVVKAHDVLHNRDCYRVVFSDGSEIIADGDHLWATETASDRKAARRGNPRPMGVRKTSEIRATLHKGGLKLERNHSVPVAGPLQMPHALLPIEPYLLGAWLGDGSSHSGEITTADDEVVEAFLAAGESVGAARAAGGASSTYRITKGYVGSVAGRAASFTGRLRSLGVLGDKHIPARYLRAAHGQRLELLQGLMDTDGYAGPSNAEFCSTSERLAKGVFELVASLGMIPRLTEDRATLDGKDCGPRYRVFFRPHAPVFRLQRKLQANRPAAAQAERTKRRFIVAVEPVETRPVRCITVDSDSHLYLAGRGMIPTHNTLTAVKNILHWIDEGWCRRIAIVGQGEGDIRSVMIAGKSGFIAQSPSWNKPDFRPSVGVGELHWPNGAIGQVYSAEDAEALRGPEFDAGWFDEPMAVPAKKREEAYSNLEYGLRLGLNPKLIITTTPKPHKWLKEKVAECKRQEHLPLADREFILTQGSTFENEANLAPSYIKKIKRNEGTRRGRQEIYAEILNEDEGALWTMESLDRCRMKGVPQDPRERRDFIANLRETMERIVIGVDPNTTEGKTTHAAGIVVVGKRGGKHFVFHDGSLVGAKPIRWGERIINLADEYGAHEIVAETNQGGDMIKGVCEQAASNLDLPMPKFRKEHTRKSKARRAEPVATAYERLEVFHVGHKGSEAAEGPFYKLEEQMETVHEGHDGTGEDFDRCDALCYAISRLGVKKSAATGVSTGGGGFMSFGEFTNGASN